MRTHGRYPYSAIAHRPDWDWRHGTRLAVHFDMNLEACRFAEGLCVQPANPLPDSDVVIHRDMRHG